jgi:bifunctional non-homologous end joining protein LigD
MKLSQKKAVVEITNPDKILFGKSGLTKQDLVSYYQTIAPFMMPYVKNRLVSMQRFPQGINGEIFFQKNAGDYFPSWITRVPVAKHNGDTVDYVVIDKPETLVYLANQACVPHVWLSTQDNLNKPDRMIFDLDPAPHLSFAAIQDVAKKLKDLLDELDLPSFYMLTGSRGAHIVVPLKRVSTFEQVAAFAHDVAKMLAHQFPKLITVDMHKAKRGKRVFIDWLRNGFGATAVPAYAVRAHEGAPVAMPVTWHELQKKGMSSQKYTIKNAMKRIGKVGDLWHDIDKHAVTLTQARKKLDELKKGIFS